MPDEPQESNAMDPTLRLTAEVVAAFLLGAGALILPVIWEPERAHFPAAVLPVVADSVEGLKPQSLIFLFILGGVFGSKFRASSVVLSLATISVFPLWSLLDLAMGGSHNLLPFEWAIYGFYAGIVFFGIHLVRWWRKRSVATPGPGA